MWTMLVAAAFAVTGGSGSGTGSAPVDVDVQGYLTDADGRPVEGTRTVELGLWGPGASAPDRSWTVTSEFQGGRFTAILEDFTVVDLDLTGEVSLSVTLDGVQSGLVPVGWALRSAWASVADGLSAGAIGDLDGRYVHLDEAGLASVTGDALITGGLTATSLETTEGADVGQDLYVGQDLWVGRDANVLGLLTVTGGADLTGALSVTGGASFSEAVSVGAPTTGSHAATRDYVDDTILSMGSGIAAYDGAWFTAALNTSYTIPHNLGGLPRGAQVLYAPTCVGTGAEVVHGAADLVSSTSGNLVTNGNFTNGVTGWSVTAGSPAAQGPSTTCAANSYNIWATGAYTTYAAQQNIDVTAYAAAIDAGRASVTLSGCLLGNTAEGDVAKVYARFLNSGGTELSNALISHNGGWTSKTAGAAVPSGTRTVRVQLDTATWSGNNDNRITDVSLTFTQAAAGFVRGAAIYDISSTSMKVKSGSVYLNDGLATAGATTGCYRVSAFR